MDEDQVEVIARNRGTDPACELRRVEEAEGRRDGGWQPSNHTQHLHAVAHANHLVALAMRCETLSFASLLVGPNEGADGHVVGSREVTNHVERPDLSTPLRRKRKAM